MANDIFGGLGGLGGILGNIAKNVVPKDTTEGKLINAQADLTELQKQEEELLIEIGREAYRRNPAEWPQDAKLKLIQQNIETAKGELDNAKKAQEQADAAREEEEKRGVCPNCGLKNAEGIKFCEECGTALEVKAKHCISCGIELAPNTNFCGACGAKQN
jgi:hypothetical protein